MSYKDDLKKINIALKRLEPEYKNVNDYNIQGRRRRNKRRKAAVLGWRRRRRRLLREASDESRKKYMRDYRARRRTASTRPAEVAKECAAKERVVPETAGATEAIVSVVTNRTATPLLCAAS